MRLTAFHRWAIYPFAIVLFSLLSCEKLGKDSPTSVEATAENQVLGKSSLPVVLTSPPDIIVNTTSDVSDFGDAQQISDLPGPDGVVSLREALTAANNSAGPNIIGFNIPTSDAGFDGTVFTIRPASPLPALSTDGTTINGATQRGLSGNTNEAGPEIVLDGSLLDPQIEYTAINVGSSHNRIHSLVIHSFTNGIDITGSGTIDNVVTGCFIGTDHTGSIAKPNRFFGVGSRFGASQTRIGGQSSEERNLISGNADFGIFVEFYSTQVTIQNNYVGTDVTGRNAIGNRKWGIAISSNATDILIKDNLISGNSIKGISLNVVSGVSIWGNRIGSDVDGNPMPDNPQMGIGITACCVPLTPHVTSNIQIGGYERWRSNLILGNQLSGISISDDVRDTRIIGNTIRENGNNGIGIQAYTMNANLLIQGNVITHNYGHGIVLGGGNGTGYRITRNVIHSNDWRGFDLLEGTSNLSGVTLNDPSDADTGPNNLMNYPVLESAKATPGKLIVKGYIETPNPKSVTIEFFANPVPNPGGDPTGYGEGAIHLGSDRPNPQGKFTATLPAVKPGTLITATATDADGNTSEFAANIEATVPGGN
jgi:hypothetical protein